jgi:hypothetical protein
MGLFAPPILTIVFSGWLLYRTLIKKDIKKYRNEVFGGFFFITVWIVIYTVLINIA